MNGLALCAGTGGIELGLRLALGPSHRTVCWVEREIAVAARLAARMEEGHLSPAPIHSDVKTFCGRAWRGRVDIVTAGYPCQPFSVAGKRKGASDPRHLWPHVARIVREVRPALAFFENVPGHLTKGLDLVRAELQRMGYTVPPPLVASAAQLGAGHIRRRVFILAHRGGLQLRLEPGRGAGAHWQGEAEPGVHGAERVPGDADDQGESQQGDAEREGRGRQGGGLPPHADDQGRLGRGEVSRAEVQDRWWATEPPLARVVHGLPNRVDRARALGNAVVPIVAAYAFTELCQRAGLT